MGLFTWRPSFTSIHKPNLPLQMYEEKQRREEEELYQRDLRRQKEDSVRRAAQEAKLAAQKLSHKYYATGRWVHWVVEGSKEGLPLGV